MWDGIETMNASVWGVWGGEAHCVGELWDPGALQVEEQVLSRTAMLARAGLIMVTFSSWIVSVRTSFLSLYGFRSGTGTD